MPNNYINTVSKRWHISKKKLEKYWNRAINATKRRFNIKRKDDFTDFHWRYTMGVFNRLVNKIKKERGVIMEGVRDTNDFYNFVKRNFYRLVKNNYYGLSYMDIEDFVDYMVDTFYKILEKDDLYGDLVNEYDVNDVLKLIYRVFNLYAKKYYMWRIKGNFLSNKIMKNTFEKVKRYVLDNYSKFEADKIINILNSIFNYNPNNDMYELDYKKYKILDEDEKDLIIDVFKKYGVGIVNLKYDMVSLSDDDNDIDIADKEYEYKLGFTNDIMGGIKYRIMRDERFLEKIMDFVANTFKGRDLVLIKKLIANYFDVNAIPEIDNEKLNEYKNCIKEFVYAEWGDF